MTTNFPARRNELQGQMMRLGRELPGPPTSYHVHDSLTAGATHAEVMETLGVAALEQFESERK
ncbi:MAG: hypothetical protein P4L80_05000 [Xanthobacteraceae bacterium]|nr:hypothetical protein [Xanthobacteraceae bacterium]